MIKKDNEEGRAPLEYLPRGPRVSSYATGFTAPPQEHRPHSSHGLWHRLSAVRASVLNCTVLNDSTKFYYPFLTLLGLVCLILIV